MNDKPWETKSIRDFIQEHCTILLISLIVLAVLLLTCLFLKLMPTDAAVKIGYEPSVLEVVGLDARTAETLNPVRIHRHDLVYINRLPKLPVWFRDPLKWESLSVFFELGTEEIKEDGWKVIEQVVEDLKDRPGILLMIEGNCADNGEDAGSLILLSERRANRIAELLIEQGVLSLQVMVTGNGAANPKNPGSLPEDLAENERVDIIAVELDHADLMMLASLSFEKRENEIDPLEEEENEVTEAITEPESETIFIPIPTAKPKITQNSPNPLTTTEAIHTTIEKNSDEPITSKSAVEPLIEVNTKDEDPMDFDDWSLEYSEVEISTEPYIDPYPYVENTNEADWSEIVNTESITINIEYENTLPSEAVMTEEERSEAPDITAAPPLEAYVEKSTQWFEDCEEAEVVYIEEE